MKKYTFNTKTRSSAKLKELKNLLLKDGESSYSTGSIGDLDAIIKSGLYFATLATELDSIRQKLKSGGENEQKIDQIIEQLFKLQEKYKIVNKPSKA